MTDRIIQLTPSRVKLQLGDRTVSVDGEAIMPGYGPPDFVVYANTVNRWDPAPGDTVGEALREDERALVFQALRESFAERKIALEIE